MIFKTLSLTFVLALVLIDSAQAQQQALVSVVLGRPLGTVNGSDLGDCDDHGSFPLHNIVITRPGAGVGSDIVYRRPRCGHGMRLMAPGLPMAIQQPELAPVAQ